MAPRDPTRSMLAAVGEVANESSKVEQRLRELFGLLIDSPFGPVIVAGEDISMLVTSCLRVLRYDKSLSTDAVDRLIRLCKAIETIRPMRNFLVHALWEKLNEPGQHWGARSSRVSPRASGAGPAEFDLWTVKDARKVSAAFSTLNTALRDFIAEEFDRRPFFSMTTRADDERIMATFTKWIGQEAAENLGIVPVVGRPAGDHTFDV